MYNLTGIDLANNTIEHITELNTLTEGYLIGFILIILYIGLIIFYDKDNVRKSFVVSSFILTLVSLIVWAIGWVKYQFIIVPIVLLFISIFVYLFTE